MADAHREQAVVAHIRFESTVDLDGRAEHIGDDPPVLVGPQAPRDGRSAGRCGLAGAQDCGSMPMPPIRAQSRQRRAKMRGAGDRRRRRLAWRADILRLVEPHDECGNRIDPCRRRKWRCSRRSSDRDRRRRCGAMHSRARVCRRRSRARRCSRLWRDSSRADTRAGSRRVPRPAGPWGSAADGCARREIRRSAECRNRIS